MLSRRVSDCAKHRPVLTYTKEEQGLHAEELFLGDLQQLELLRQMSHPYAVLIHGGNVHPVSANVKKKKGKDEGCDLMGMFKSQEAKEKLLCTQHIYSVMDDYGRGKNVRG